MYGTLTRCPRTDTLFPYTTRSRARREMNRIEVSEDRFTASIAFQPRSGHLSVDIEAISAQGGLLAALLDRPDLPGSNLKLVGSGPLADWSGDFTLALGDLATAQGDLALQRDGSSTTAFRLAGTIDVRPQKASGPTTGRASGRERVCPYV